MNQDFFVNPTKEMLASVKLKLADSKTLDSTAISKVAKNLKFKQPPVARFFDSPAQISSYYAEGEYDLVAIFKLLKYESYFQKSVYKKLGLLCKSGFQFHSDNDKIKEYVAFRFKLMQIQTGLSINTLVKRISFYLIACSNAWVVKVRDKDFEYGESYTLDGKEIHPVVGLFIPHPTTMKPRFKYVKDSTQGAKWQTRLELDKWVHINRRGVFKVFDLEDVIHFSLYKEDGMIFGTPEVTPTIDDIRTLRKLEEDAQLLSYRDLFPIIHYTVENPKAIDHTSGYTELDQAQSDMQKLMQDGGIATDKRHEIKFVGNEGKGVDGVAYLSYFQNRVFSGLGMAASDFGLGGQGAANDQEQVSQQLTDSVKFIQQEVSDQFAHLILDEIMIQSPFKDAFELGNEVTLKFDEIDVGWKIRTENHEADLFTKGVNTIHETRNKMGRKDATDEDLAYSHPGLYGASLPNPTLTNTAYGDQFIQKQAKLAKLSKPPVAGAGKGGSSADAAAKRNKVSRSSKSSADKDSVKSSRTSSNITKHKDIFLEDELELQDQFRTYAERILQDKNKSSQKVNLMLGTKVVYDSIKNSMAEAFKEGATSALRDLGLEDQEVRLSHPIYANVDKLRDVVTDAVFADHSYLNRASLRIATTKKTETKRAFNLGVSTVCLQNGIKEVELYSEFDDISEESSKIVGTKIILDKKKLLEQLPPYHCNSGLICRPVPNEEPFINNQELT